MARLIVDGFEIDGELRTVPQMDSEATDFPVESGADLTDHVRQLPIELELEGIVSDTPIGGMKEIRASALADRAAVPGPELPAQKPSALALAHFERIRARRLPVTIQTSTKLYERMAMIGFSPPRDATTGKALHFTARFKQITTVANERSAVKTATPRAQGTAKGGAKPAQKRDISDAIPVFTLKPLAGLVDFSNPNRLINYQKAPRPLRELDAAPIGKTSAGHHFLPRPGDWSDGYFSGSVGYVPYEPKGLIVPEGSQADQQNAKAVMQGTENADKIRSVVNRL